MCSESTNLVFFNYTNQIHGIRHESNGVYKTSNSKIIYARGSIYGHTKVHMVKY
jgi:hypothetical protein